MALSTEFDAVDFVTFLDEAGVGSLWVSPDGCTLFAGTGTGEVVELNVLTGERLTSYTVSPREPSLGTRSLQACSADLERNMIAWAAGGGNVRIVDIASHAVVHRFDESRRMSITWCALDPKGRGLWHTAAGRSPLVEFPTHVRLVDIPSGRELADLRRRPGSPIAMRQPGLTSVALSGDGEYLALGCRDGTIGLFDAVRFKRLKHKRAHWDVVSACAFSPNGSLLVTGGYKHASDVKVWTVPDLHKVATFEGHRGGVWTCAMSSDDETFASGGGAGPVVVRNLYRDGQERPLAGHTDIVVALAFAPSGERLFSASCDGTVRAWTV